MKLLKTIRADASDTFVFATAAEPGEWAVSGAFLFAGLDPSELAGKTRAAFRGGFLGVGSFGWSTLAQVVSVTRDEWEAAIEMLADGLVSRLGAPDLKTARPAAREEIEFAASLCDHPEGTLVAVSRRHTEEGTQEMFRTLAPRATASGIRPFAFLEAPDEPAESVDLTALAVRGKE